MWLQNREEGEKEIVSKSINILLIEDNAGDIRLIREMLKDVNNLLYKVEASFLLSKALKILESRKFDVILLDINLPDSVGIETVSKTLEVARDTPVIVLISLNERDLAISTVKMGIQDYLVKEQLNSMLLARSIQHAIERKKNEQKLKDNSEFNQNVFNAIQDGVSVLDLDLNIVKVNPYMIEKYGSIDQIVNKKCYDVYQKRSSPCLWCPSILTIETGQSNTSIVPYPTSENPTGWIELTADPIKNSDGIVEGIIEHVKDITERKKTEKNYKNLAKEMELIRDNIPELIFYKDAENNFIRVNQYFANRYKLTKKEFEGKSCFDFYSKEQAQAYWDEDLEVINSGKPNLNIVEPWETEDGIRWLNTKKIPTYDDNGKCTGIIGFSTYITAQVKAEQKLKHAHEQFITIFSNLKDTVFVISEDYKILFKNDTAHDLFGTDLIGKDCYEVIKGQDQPCEHCPMKTFAENDLCQVRFEQCINTPLLEGERVFDIVASPIESYAGQPAMVEVLRDNTERVKMKAEIRKLSAYNRNLIEMSLDPLVTISPGGKITDVNRATEIVTGRSREELKGTEFKSYFTEPERASEGYKKVFETGSVHDYELGLQHIDGHVTPVMYNASTFKDEAGNVIGVFAAARDITKRKLAEQKLKEYSRNLEDLVKQRTLNLRESEEKYRYLLETAVMGLIEIDLMNNELTYFNPKLLEIVGYRKKALNHETFAHKIIYPEDREKIFKSSGEKEFEFRIYAKDKKLKWLSGSRKNIYDEKGEPIKMRLWLQDITERKEIEEIKSNLLTRFSHEFKTPLISIRGFADFLLATHEDKLDKKALSFLINIKNGSERLNSLVNTFIESSYLDRDFSKLELSSENLFTLIKTAIREVKELADLRDHIINVNIPENLMVEIDKEKIYTVITNIIFNAIKYTPTGGGIISIRSKIEEDFNSISIIDNGIGFTGSEKEKLFKKFGKIERYGYGWDIITDGIGMGLYISKQIITEHGGKIWAESQGRNRGSTFTFTIPFRKNKE